MRLNNGLAPAHRSPRNLIRAVIEERRELETLRLANLELKRELAELKVREAQATQLADRDGLTGLLNRRRMMELLETAIAQAAEKSQFVGLLFVDLNGFKSVNDEHGHAAGDKILTTVAARIAAKTRNGDFVCRYGGDEFVVLLPYLPDEAAMTRVADMIRERLALPYWISGNEQHLTAAIGASMYPHDGKSAAELLSHADRAMYRGKVQLARPTLTLGNLARERLYRRRDDKSSLGSGSAE